MVQSGLQCMCEWVDSDICWKINHLHKINVRVTNRNNVLVKIHVLRKMKIENSLIVALSLKGISRKTHYYQFRCLLCESSPQGLYLLCTANVS